MSVIPPNPLFGKSMRDNTQRAQMAALFIWIVMGVEILSLGSSLAQYVMLRGMRSGVEYSEFFVSANYLREGLIGMLYAAVYIVSAVMFIRWFRRAWYNLHTRVAHLSWSEGWAAGAWFVPGLNLFRPCQIMRELYDETRRILLKRKSIQAPALPADAVVSWWWTLWICSAILGNLSFRLALRAESVDEWLTMTACNMTAGVLGIPLAIVTVKVIRDYARVEPALALPEEESTFE